MEKVPSETLVESSGFPVGLVSEKSAGEKAGGGRPPYWEMVFWWTRKPLISARAIIAGALVPSSVNVNEFCRVLRLNEKTPHSHNPVLPEHWRRWFEGKSLLDPFAGFGSIPLEALRLGLSKVVAVELLPTAYVFLKAVLEYPLKYGEQLAKDVERWGNWITEQLRKDPLIKQLYDPDVAVYIGSWEIKCPHCQKWTPLIGNWWLARVSKNRDGDKVYTRLAWMKPKIEGDNVLVEVVDLNRLLKRDKFEGAKIDAKRGTVILPDNKTFEVPKPTRSICVLCNNNMPYIDSETGKCYIKKSEVSKEIRKKLIGYVKYALKKYNERDETLVKPTLLAKVKDINRTTEFEPCTKDDRRALELAKLELEKILEQRNVDVPTERVAPFGATIRTTAYGFDTWHKHFNSRQLLTLAKLVKLIREVGKKVHGEELKDGAGSRGSRNYAEAVVTLLSISLVKYVDFNSVVNHWTTSWLFPNETLAMRRPGIQWNWCDVNPFADTTGSWVRSVKSATDGIRYLSSFLNPGHKRNSLTIYSHIKDEGFENNIEVLFDDATILGKVDSEEKFDLIVTDPPYYDDVQYAELSDLYYVWLKRALCDVYEGKLVPKFLPEAFFRQIGAKSVEIRTQWEEFATKEVSVNPARFKSTKKRVDIALSHFLDLLTRSFVVSREHLGEASMLVTYYAHTSPDAWVALLEAGWRGGKSHVVNAFPIATESLQRATARGKYALDTSIVVIWRKGSSGSTSADELYDRAIKEARVAALELIKAGRMGSDLFVGTMASILSLFTRYENLYSPLGVLDVKSLVTDYVYPATAKALAMALGEFAGTPGEVKRPESLFYLITKALFEKPQRAKRKLDRSNTALLSIGTKAELDMLQDLVVLRKEKENFYLEEPATADRKSFEELLQRKSINPAKPAIESPIGALHLLEYYALTLPLSPFLNRFSQLKAEYSSEVEEAINIAAILAKTLPATDPEKGACQEIIARIKGEKLA